MVLTFLIRVSSWWVEFCQDRDGPSGLKVRVKGHERHVEILSIVEGGSPQAVELRTY